jgi:surfactin synthase thioesterase subunit
LLTLRIVQNGAGANMLKVGSKRRRPHAELKAEKEEEKKKEDDFQKKLLDLKAYEQKLHLQKNELRNVKEAG